METIQHYDCVEIVPICSLLSPYTYSYMYIHIDRLRHTSHRTALDAVILATHTKLVETTCAHRNERYVEM